MTNRANMIRVSGLATQYWQTLGRAARACHILRCYAMFSRASKMKFGMKFKLIGRSVVNFRELVAALALCVGTIAGAAAHSAAEDSASRPHSAERADIARFRARVAAVLSQANAEKLNWGIAIADRS